MELWLLAFLQIMLINLILSGDNAIVIAMASRKLPEAKRKVAVFWGAFAAIGLRVGLTVIAIQLLQIPYMMAIGGLLLLWIAVKLLMDEEEQQNIQASQQLGLVIMTIVMADFIMSLDNVIAIAAIAQGDLMLITLGLALSIPIIVWGSSFLLKLLDRFPLFIYIGAAILAFTGGEMVMGDEKISGVLEQVAPVSHLTFSLLIALIVVIWGWLWKRIEIIH